ncbi:hypothetical protein JSQ81_15990 [Sporosarcina sp. Marseille-Q4063]|uniref:hypothetical protein n=1 Tax=Sporosarcina sp. Marseille-Q4063 TaxID=2810514 RepID=UPI001BAF7A20|nr:hypothetical protein [Sporosarcina sp. Marseille-Q4063]QUW21291.1 hypothetical protein JSQ81_15990 [Sporosarcina sp. Marseille-Q4063]
MSFCESCGTPLDGEKFCKNCGTEQENSNSLVMVSATNTPSGKKKRRITIIAGCVAVVVLGIAYYYFGSGINETETIKEVAIPEGEKELASEVHDRVVDQEKDEKMTPRLLYQDINILDSLTEGSFIETFHIGRTREELLDNIGPANVEYFREGESRFDYSDATYMCSPNNEKIYSVMLLLNSDDTADFQGIRDALGNGTEHLLADSGKDDTDSYFLSYGTEDSLITFYSNSEQGQPIYKIVYSNLSVYSADPPVVQKEIQSHPGEIEPIVLQIRKEYHTVNEQVSSMKQEGLGKGKIAYLNEQGIIRKVIENTTEGSVEYYFDRNQDLFFIFQHKGSVEHRFYFAEDQMIRWIPPSKITIDYDEGQSNSEYEEWETTWLERAYE